MPHGGYNLLLKTGEGVCVKRAEEEVGREDNRGRLCIQFSYMCISGGLAGLSNWDSFNAYFMPLVFITGWVF